MVKGPKGNVQIARLSVSSVNEKIAMCADPGWGDLLVHRYRKRRVRKSTQKAETAEVHIGAPRKIAPQKARKIISQITSCL